VVGGNVNAGNYCSMINNLMNTKSGGIRGYCTMDSVRAHEMWHRTVDLPVLAAQAGAKFWVDVRKISVACNSGDPAAGQQAARNAYDKAWADFQTDYFNRQNAFSANHDAKK